MGQEKRASNGEEDTVSKLTTEISESIKIEKAVHLGIQQYYKPIQFLPHKNVRAITSCS